MISFIVKRLMHGILAVVVLSLLVFIGVRTSGDPTTLMFQAGEPSKEEIAQIKEQLGLDKSYATQYFIFLRQLLKGDLGKSYYTNQKVSAMIGERLGATMILTLSAMLISFCISFPIGILSALKRGSLLDMFGQSFAIFGLSMPNFWLGIIFILLFAVNLRWLPPSGFESWEYIILPSLTLGLILSGILARLVRSSMLDTMNRQYIVTARAKGIAEWRVILLHGFRNALIPVVTYIGLQFGALLGGTVIIEKVFSWPGIGRMLVDAISQRDFPVIQGTVFFLAIVMVLTNFIVDVTYGFLDPRIRVT
ncbi:ABC transporter permease [bacterium]|nr:ABC transporter permease [bacterium]